MYDRRVDLSLVEYTAFSIGMLGTSEAVRLRTKLLWSCSGVSSGSIECKRWCRNTWGLQELEGWGERLARRRVRIPDARALAAACEHVFCL